MAIARQSVVHPRPGSNARVEQIFDELLAIFATSPGYLLGFRYRPHEASGEIGRITVWRRLEDADHAAQNSHMIALRAELSRIIQGDHIERVLTIEGTPHNLPSP